MVSERSVQLAACSVVSVLLLSSAQRSLVVGVPKERSLFGMMNCRPPCSKTKKRCVWSNNAHPSIHRIWPLVHALRAVQCCKLHPVGRRGELKGRSPCPRGLEAWEAEAL